MTSDGGSRASGCTPALTDDELRHPETPNAARLMQIARAHCEHVDIVILVRCVERLRLVIVRASLPWFCTGGRNCQHTRQRIATRMVLTDARGLKQDALAFADAGLSAQRSAVES